MYGNRPSFGGPRGGGNGPRFSPVKVGQEIDVKIEAVGEKGDGIAKEKGFVLFVPGGKTGDEVRIKVTKVLRNVGFAEIIGSSQGSVKKEETQETAASESSEEESSYDSQEEETSESSQDSEDFGEEYQEQ